MSEQAVLARVDSISPLTDSIVQLILIPEQYVDYQAGQYLQILVGDEAYSYSIANAPLGSRKYELHMRHSRENPVVDNLLAQIKRDARVTIRLPLGKCHVHRLHTGKPVIFIAGGTGFAPVKAMIEQLLITREQRAFELYWGARSKSDLYMDEQVLQWQKHVQHFQYFSLLSDVSKDTLASRVITRHRQDLAHWDIVMSGPFDMVYSTRDALLTHGAQAENLFADAFEFEANK
ncbi:NAD(P)H-flavin reductase [Legionella septentrionalis]|uniref:NAD(P)H-flavin reductase n=1 Tax=Legionella septentrionalis TaxID=2498109 RepID=UPI000F8CB3E2|nr:NAD(P)H-flavin reductase [Legionella septentrionalis]RUR11272.1 NAD(P)H-flavin reductase [Legionella septentrionalis]